jgi:hypothetical protein
VGIVEVPSSKTHSPRNSWWAGRVDDQLVVAYIHCSVSNKLAAGLPKIDSSPLIERATNAFDSVTRVTEEWFGDFTGSIFKFGDRSERGMVDLMFDVLRLELFTPREMMKAAFDVMQQSADTLGLLTQGQAGYVVWQEFKNKLQAFSLFEHVDSALNLPLGIYVPLIELVEKTSALESYPAIWATEGAGHYYAETIWEQNRVPHNLFRDGKASALPATSMTALHAGMGLSFANRALATIKSQSLVSEVHNAIQKFVALCEDNSRRGYFGAAYESLGLVARNLYPHMVGIIDRHLSEMDHDLLGYFWHGVGRALYFAPTNFLPCSSSPWRAVEMSERESPHELGRLNALAGLAWALTLVNIRQPEILEAFLKCHGDRLADSDAFSNGVMSSIIIWRHSAMNDSYITQLLQYQPDPSHARLVDLWNSQVRGPCEEAFQQCYDELKEHDCLGELFRYQSLPKLVAQLGRGPWTVTSPS